MRKEWRENVQYFLRISDGSFTDGAAVPSSGLCSRTGNWSLPGLTGNMAIALMVPMTFGMQPSVGLAFLAAIYCSSIYGGSISAILLGIPGTISSFATTLDGYPLAKQGKAGLALGTSTMASVFGGLFSALVLMFLTPVLADFALKFGPGEYFAISLLGIACITSISGDNIPKGLLSGMIGLLIAVIGMVQAEWYSAS